MAGLVVLQVKDNCLPPAPIPGATVTVESGTAAISVCPATDQSGICNIYGSAGTYPMKVRKIGCVTLETTVTIVDLQTGNKTVHLPCSWCF